MNALTALVWRRWLALLGVAAVSLAPALLVTSLAEVSAAGASATIVNGRLVPDGATDSWATLLLSAVVDGVEVRLAVPVLVVLGWVVALAVGLRVLAGATFRAAWRQAGVHIGAWGPVGALLAALAAAALFALLVLIAVPNVVALFAAAAGLYGLARLAPALPTILIDGYGAADAVRRAVALTRGRAIVESAVPTVAGLGVPAVVFGFADAIAERLAANGATASESVVWVGAGSLVQHLALIAAVSVPTVFLLTAYRAATTPAESAPEPANAVGALERWLGATGLALLVAVPAVVTSAVVLANPHRVPVATVADPVSGFSSRPLALRVLDDGTTASVDDMQVGLCIGSRCPDQGIVSLPCRDGAARTPLGEGVSGCSIEGPLNAADLTADGTLLAVTRDRQKARFFWCRVMRDETCQWGGATTLQQLPKLWESWSMAVAATPAGGFAAVLLGPGRDDRHGELLLATCERLDCPQPTVRGVLDVPMADVWQGGVVDISVDRVSGSLALGYYDRTTSTLWLGGCAAGCAGGPVLTRAGTWPESVSTNGFIPSLDTVATPTGPVAVVTVLTRPDVVDGSDGTEITTVIDCDGLSCATSHSVGSDGWASVGLAVDGAGAAFVVVSPAPDARPLLLNVRTLASTALAGQGTVVAAAFGADDRLRTVLLSPTGLTLVTCATSHCARG